MLASIDFSAGVVTVRGSSGVDTALVQVSSGRVNFDLTANGQDFSESFAVADVNQINIYGYGGDDNLDNRSSIGGTINGGSGDDTIRGSYGNDIIRGSTGDDFLVGRGGDDVIYGQGGQDTLYGYNGNDTLIGGDLYDTLVGGNGNDIIRGNAGNDTLIGGAGNDNLNGGAGNDTLSGNDDDDTISGSSGDDLIFGDNGDDKLYGNSDEDIIYGGSGNDKLYGGTENDSLFGDQGDDFLSGSSGNDLLRGGDGIDRLFGGDDNDNLFGGIDGDIDFLSGGQGLDRHLVEDQVVTDTQASVADADAVVTFTNINANQVWTDSEVEQVSGALDILFNRTNNNGLLQNYLISHSDIKFVNSDRLGVGANVLYGRGTEDSTDDLRVIELSDEAFTSSVFSLDQIVVHEIAHSFHDIDLVGFQDFESFRRISQWTIYGPFDTRTHGIALDGSEAYLLGSDFAQIRGDAGSTNSFEDWATSWEQYFFDALNASGQVVTKLRALDSFFNGFESESI